VGEWRCPTSQRSLAGHVVGCCCEECYSCSSSHGAHKKVRGRSSCAASRLAWSYALTSEQLFRTQKGGLLLLAEEVVLLLLLRLGLSGHVR
jgi:hypothetical protein